MTMYVNAVPNAYFTGYKDTPYPGVSPAAPIFPNHCPLSFIPAHWGAIGVPISAMGDELISTFHGETFNVRSQYFQHSTDYVKHVFNNGESLQRQFVTRVEFPNMQVARVRLSVEAVADNIVQLERDPLKNNQPVLDVNGDVTTTSDTKPGYILMPTMELITDPADIGKAVVKEGTFVAPGGGKAQVYPIADFVATYESVRGNHFKVTLYPIDATNEVNSTKMEHIDAFLYQLGFLETSTTNAVGIPWYTITGNDTITCALSPNVVDVDANLDYSVDKLYPQNFINEDVPHSGMEIHGPADKSVFYNEHLATLLDLLYVTEKDETSATGTSSAAINFATASDLEGNPYYTIQLAANTSSYPNAVDLIEGASYSFGGGHSGDITFDNFDAAVQTTLKSVTQSKGVVNNKDGKPVEYFDFAHYPFTVMYDSGYSPETKEAMAPWLSIMPMLFVAVQNASANQLAYMTYDEEVAMGNRLLNVFNMYIESKMWNTPTTRAMIVPWAGVVNDVSGYTGVVTPNRWLAKVCAKMCGLSTAKWRNTYRPDLGDAKVIDTVTLKNYVYGSLSARNDLWKNQLIMMEYTNPKQVIVSAYQTVNPNDSSTLNNLFNVWAMITGSIAAYRAYKYCVGAALSEMLIKKEAERVMVAYLNGCATQYAVYTPTVEFSARDKNAGYAWTTKVGVGMNGGKTANTIIVNSYAVDALTSKEA